MFSRKAIDRLRASLPACLRAICSDRSMSKRSAPHRVAMIATHSAMMPSGQRAIAADFLERSVKRERPAAGPGKEFPDTLAGLVRRSADIERTGRLITNCYETDR